LTNNGGFEYRIAMPMHRYDFAHICAVWYHQHTKPTPVEVDMLSGKSLMCTEKIKGASNEHYGTPDVIGKRVDVAP
jgi:hypothetical protein